MNQRGTEEPHRPTEGWVAGFSPVTTGKLEQDVSKNQENFFIKLFFFFLASSVNPRRKPNSPMKHSNRNSKQHTDSITEFRKWSWAFWTVIKDIRNTEQMEQKFYLLKLVVLLSWCLPPEYTTSIYHRIIELKTSLTTDIIQVIKLLIQI